jgi:hypothetical protein
MKFSDNINIARTSLSSQTGGVISTSALTVDNFSVIEITQVTGTIFAPIVCTLPTPFDVTTDVLVEIINVGPGVLSIYGKIIESNRFATFLFSGSNAWVSSASNPAPSPFAIPTTTNPNTDPLADGAKTGKISVGSNLAPGATIDDFGTLTTRSATTVNNATGAYSVSATQVDLNSMFKLKQITVDCTITIAAPATSLAAGRFLRLHNDETSTKNLIYNARVIEPGRYMDLQWNGTVWANESLPYAGNTILDTQRVPLLSNTPFSFDNYTVTFNGSASPIVGLQYGLSIKQNIALAGVTMHYNGFISYSGDGVAGAGVVNDSNLNATPISLSTSDISFGEINMEQQVEIRRYHLYFSTGQHYIFEIIRDDTFISATIDKVGISTNQVLSATNGIQLLGGVISDANRIAKMSIPIVNAHVGTEVLTFGEFDWRYSTSVAGAGGSNGNLYIRSAIAKTANDVWWSADEEFIGTENQTGVASQPMTANTYTQIGTLGAGIREALTYRICTQNNFYIVKLINHNDTHIHLIIEKEA